MKATLYLVRINDIFYNNLLVRNLIIVCHSFVYLLLFLLELDCMEAFLDLNPLLRNTSPILRVFKSESPFVNQRKKRDVSREFTQTSLVRSEGTQK